MQAIEITPTSLKGNICIPPSKSLCHRAILAAAMAEDTSTISNVLLSRDVMATVNAVQALGAKVCIDGQTAIVTGGIQSKESKVFIDCDESGSTLRFIIPIGLLSEQELHYSGRTSLAARPLNPYIEIFKQQNIHYSSPKLPMCITGKLKPGTYTLRGDISSQFITGLMYALPKLQADSTIQITGSLESKAYIDLTIDTLNHFGIVVSNDSYRSFSIKGRQQYNCTDFNIEGDYSQAAFWIAAGLLGGGVTCLNLAEGSKQADKAFIDIMQKAGAHIQQGTNFVTAYPSKLKAFHADVSQSPDIAPILAVMAATASGESRITGASRLRIKESDRLQAISTELSKLGADIYEYSDQLVINGKSQLKGGAVDSWGDHRIAMALSIASIKCSSPVSIMSSEAVGKSYPDFYLDFVKLGGIINERKLG